MSDQVKKVYLLDCIICPGCGGILVEGTKKCKECTFYMEEGIPTLRKLMSDTDDEDYNAVSVEFIRMVFRAGVQMAEVNRVPPNNPLPRQ